MCLSLAKIFGDNVSRETFVPAADRDDGSDMFHVEHIQVGALIPAKRRERNTAMFHVKHSRLNCTRIRH